MKNDMMILAKDRYYSLNTMETQLNNNVLVVGASGAGKTRSIVSPNILQAHGSYVISDPKGNLYQKYGDYLKKKGYRVQKLDFTDPKNSSKYNFFNYIHDNQDIIRISQMIVYQKKEGSLYDPFWDRTSQILIQSVISYLIETKGSGSLHEMMDLLDKSACMGDTTENKSELDELMEQRHEEDPDSYAWKSYQKVRIAADRTYRSVLISANSLLGMYDTKELKNMLSDDTTKITDIGCYPTAFFVVVSDTDRSMDTLANLFFTQAMNELCLYADKKCKNNRLPVPVRFIMDDFATNCKIEEFPRMIASIRSRGISAMLMIQAESQLEEGYQMDAKTIIGNCDTYVYLGGNDVETAKNVSYRCDLPMKKILNMPVGMNWIFRRGQDPVLSENFELDPFASQKMSEIMVEPCI